MVNANVICWLLTGGMLGWLVLLQNRFSTAALFLSIIATVVSLIVLGLIRRQPVR
jgi:hypothetical protein